jgi:ABC-type transport system involved in cytochrome c biogenesis ATPase subunit
MGQNMRLPRASLSGFHTSLPIFDLEPLDLQIGVLGLNGAGKSTLLRIMAGIDTDIDGEARPQPGLNVGYLPQ